MKIQLHQSPGLRNDLLIVLDRDEIEQVHLHIAERAQFMTLPGLTRHRAPTDAERQANRECKIPVERHLEQLGLAASTGVPNRRILAVGNRNLGNNHRFIAWQANEEPRFFHINGDPLQPSTYSCLVLEQTRTLSIRNVQHTKDHRTVFDSGEEVEGKIEWATYGQHVLRSGRVVDIEQIIAEFYDIRHVLAYDRNQINPHRHNRGQWLYKNYPDGQTIDTAIYQDYPDAFKEKTCQALRDGVPRARYLHNCIGLSRDSIFILQREGTVEEVAHSLREAGAEDGLILDNGGSVFTWAWFVDAFCGGFLFTAPDFRPPSSAVLAFVLKGAVRADLPSGTLSPAVV